MSILVHDGKQKKNISTSTIFLTFLDFKVQKNYFQWNLDSCFNVETLFKMATCEFNHESDEWTTRINTTLRRMLDLCYSTI
jgi:hypothetical protein